MLVIIKRISILLLFLSIETILIGQNNLIPNYSFEESDSCGKGSRGLDPLCKDWFTPMSQMDTADNPLIPNNYGSSDYFNPCNWQGFQTPNNIWGYQIPFHDSSYAGFGLIGVIHPPNNPYHQFKEYIEVQLTSELVSGAEYSLEFYYSIATFYNYPNIEIQASVTDYIVKREPHPLYWFDEIAEEPILRHTLPIHPDTTNWIKASTFFIASGGEKYLTIGNFQNTDHFNNCGIYVFIDNVKLWYNRPDTIPTSSISVYPNPMNSKLFIEFQNVSFENSRLVLFDVMGKKVLDQPIIEDITNKSITDLSKLSAGSYIYHIRAGNGMWEKGKLIKF